MRQTINRPQLRKDLRAQRRNLSPEEQMVAASCLFANIRQLRPLRRARKIALYLPNDGEIDPSHLAQFIQSTGKQCYLPVVRQHSARPLMFALATAGTTFTVNRFGIAEPKCSAKQLVYGQQLDIIIMPLVAFDTNLNRMGMGGGFYDRAFASHNRHQHFKRPLLIGVAHDFQKVKQLERQPWDVTVDGIITDSQIYE